MYIISKHFFVKIWQQSTLVSSIRFYTLSPVAGTEWQPADMLAAAESLYSRVSIPWLQDSTGISWQQAVLAQRHPALWTDLRDKLCQHRWPRNDRGNDAWSLFAWLHCDPFCGRAWSYKRFMLVCCSHNINHSVDLGVCEDDRTPAGPTRPWCWLGHWWRSILHGRGKGNITMPASATISIYPANMVVP